MTRRKAAGKGFLKALADARQRERVSGSGPQGENSRSEVEGEAPQNGGEAVTPNDFNSLSDTPEAVALADEIARMRRMADDWRRPNLRQVEGPNDLKIYGGTIADDIDRWAGLLTALRSTPNAGTANDPGAAPVRDCKHTGPCPRIEPASPPALGLDRGDISGFETPARFSRFQRELQMTTEPHTVEVTQADRDAAAFVCRRWSPTVLDMIRAGKADGSPEVQAFARHRLASTPPLPATEMVEAVAREMEAALCVEAGRNVGAIWASERGREQMFTAARAVTAGIVERCAKVADREQERWHKMGVQMLNAGHAVTGYASRAEEAKDIAAAIRSLPLAPEG